MFDHVTNENSTTTNDILSKVDTEEDSTVGSTAEYTKSAVELQQPVASGEKAEAMTVNSAKSCVETC